MNVSQEVMTPPAFHYEQPLIVVCHRCIAATNFGRDILSVVCNLCEDLPTKKQPTTLGGNDGERRAFSRARSSCAGLRRFIQNQKIVGSYSARGRGCNLLGQSPGRPAALLAELRDPTIRNADGGSEIATVDAFALEICG